ncbi:MAG: hypothetical protein K9K93_00510 [Acholeplasmataceae bacterium]|nr:hypothetical protein [Acholeplasmataceae bacterium]
MRKTMTAILAITLLMIVMPMIRISAAERPDVLGKTSIVEWPNHGLLIPGQLDPLQNGQVINDDTGQKIIPVNEDMLYQSRNDSFLVPTLLDHYETVMVDNGSGSQRVSTADLTLYIETSLTFGEYTGNEGYKGAGVHVRGQGSNQLRVRILRDLNSNGFAEMFIEHVNNGVGTEVKLVPLTLTAEDGDTLQIQILSEPEQLSVWINGDQYLNDQTVPKLSAHVGMYYADNHADFTDFEVYVVDDLVYYDDAFSWDKPQGNEHVMIEGTELASTGSVWSFVKNISILENTVTNGSVDFQDTFMLLNQYLSYPVIDLEEGDEVNEVSTGEVPFYIKATLEVDAYQNSDLWYSIGLTFKASNAGIISVLVRRSGHIYVVHHTQGEERYIDYRVASGFSSFESGEPLVLEIISTATDVSIYINGVEEIRHLDLKDYYDNTGTTIVGETGVEQMRHTVGAWFAYASGTATINDAYFLKSVTLTNLDGDDDNDQTYPEEEILPNNFESIDPPGADPAPGRLLVIIGSVMIGITGIGLIGALVMILRKKG